MLNLNLLPPREKLNLGYEMRTRAILASGFLLIATLAVGCTLLLPTMFLLSFQTAGVVRALDIERQYEAQSGISADIAVIKQANSRAAAISRNMDTRSRFSPIAQGVLAAVPPSISLSLISYSSANRQIRIEGFAPTRASLLGFIEALKRRPEIRDVTSPVSNVVHDTDIVFLLTVAIR